MRDLQTIVISREQLRPALGLNFGTPEEPNCQGLTPTDMETADWSQVNLDEWTAILSLTGQLPTAADISTALTDDALNGVGSSLNADGNRQSAEERTRGYLDGLDLDGLNQGVANGLYPPPTGTNP